MIQVASLVLRLCHLKLIHVQDSLFDVVVVDSIEVIVGTGLSVASDCARASGCLAASLGATRTAREAEELETGVALAPEQHYDQPISDHLECDISFSVLVLLKIVEGGREKEGNKSKEGDEVNEDEHLNTGLEREYPEAIPLGDAVLSERPLSLYHFTSNQILIN